MSKWRAAFERKVLRRKYGGDEVNGNWKKRYSEELMQVFGELSILSFVRISRLNWICHINRIDTKRKVGQVFNNNRQGNRLSGRPKNRWWN